MLDEVLSQRMIVEPLGLLEVPGRADGAVALVVTSEDFARSSGKPPDHLDYSIRLTGGVDFQSIFGAVPISWYAMAARRYMHEHNVSRAQIAEIAVNNRRQAGLNPLAQFRTPITACRCWVAPANARLPTPRSR